MPSDVLSRWPVLLEVPVEDSDRDRDGRLTDAAAERAFAHARSAYIEMCATLDEAEVEARDVEVTLGAAVAGEAITVSAQVSEVYPSRFTMTARIRPIGAEGVAATARCSMSTGSDLTEAVRDELVRLAHSAPHWH